MDRAPAAAAHLDGPATHGSGRLSDALGWYDPDGVTNQLITSLDGVSHGDTAYTIVDRQEIDEWPVLADGFAYTEDSWFGCWSDHATCHSPFLVDYLRILNEHHSCDLRNDGGSTRCGSGAHPSSGTGNRPTGPRLLVELAATYGP
jgi:hypothetical protein